MGCRTGLYRRGGARHRRPLRQGRRVSFPRSEWPAYAPVIAEINRLKREKDAVILAHNYMTPEIFHCVGDFVGDSLALAREAARTDAKVIVQAGVHFMAETSKILSPEKTVLIPSMEAGCSLAASITGADVRLLQAEISRPAGGDLCEHLRRREGGKRYLLHQRQCREGGGGHRARFRHRYRHHDPGQVSGPQCRGQDRRESHHLGRRLRSA